MRGAASVDVVLVNYLSGRLLADCVARLKEFLPADAHYIFVDNSPEDGAVAAAAQLVETATVLPQPSNVGFARAVNQGVAHGSAPLLLLANPDVASISGTFDHVQALFAEHPRAAAVTGRIVLEDGVLMHCRNTPTFRDFVEAATGLNRVLPRSLRYRSLAMLEWSHDSVRQVEGTTGAFLFLRRAAYEDVGPFDERFFLYWEETDWLVRAREHGWFMLFTPELEVVHVGQASSPASAGHSLLFHESLYKYVRKHLGLPREVALRGLWAGIDGLRLLRSAYRHETADQAVLARLGVHLGRRPHRPRPS